MAHRAQAAAQAPIDARMSRVRENSLENLWNTNGRIVVPRLSAASRPVASSRGNGGGSPRSPRLEASADIDEISRETKQGKKSATFFSLAAAARAQISTRPSRDTPPTGRSRARQTRSHTHRKTLSKIR